MSAEGPYTDGPYKGTGFKKGSPQGWRVIGTSVRGGSHVTVGQECQDAHCWKKLPGDMIAAAVADGAGSAPLSKVGADLAAKASVDWIVEQDPESIPTEEAGWRFFLLKAMDHARNKVQEEARTREVEVSSLATTLTVLAATPGLVAAVQVGDGTLVLQESEGVMSAITRRMDTGYINETTFLTSPGSMEKVQSAVWTGTPTYLAVFTDGLQMLALQMPDGTPHVPFFIPLFRLLKDVPEEWRALTRLRAFLQSPRVTERADDDLTLLLAAFNP